MRLKPARTRKREKRKKKRKKLKKYCFFLVFLREKWLICKLFARFCSLLYERKPQKAEIEKNMRKIIYN